MITQTLYYLFLMIGEAKMHEASNVEIFFVLPFLKIKAYRQ